LDDTIINKDLEKSDSLELSEDKNAINDCDSKAKSISDNDSKGNFYFLNEGRWSFKEHIKFIEAIVEYGKNWKDVQKYVGSRSSTQARSHAQKFFLKLKAIKTPKFDFDFSSNNIKSLSDIIEIIKRKEDYIQRGKEYIISTLTSLSESISIESDSLCKNFKTKIKKHKKDQKSLNQINNTEHNKEIKNELFNILNDNLEENINKSKIINANSNTNKSLHKNINNNKSKENKINDLIVENKIESKDIKIENVKKEKIEKEVERSKEIKKFNNIKNIGSHQLEVNLKDCENQNNYDDFYNESLPQKYIYDDGMLYLSNNSEFFNLNNISLTIKEHISIKNSKLPYVHFNHNFFS
jgi:SHAQKYF class myb-like DNA-binding protein